MLPLSSTDNKKAIRRQWDKPIIADFSNRLQRHLNYFGLPGPDIADFLDWQEHLGWKTGVEMVSKRGSKEVRDAQQARVNELQTNVMLNGFSAEWELRRGKIEDIILNGFDIDQKTPKYFVFEKGRVPKLQYDLHNWDFQGGLHRTDNNESRRIEAIKQCIRLQKDQPFLFFLTLNVRHTLGEDVFVYLDGASKDINSDKYEEALRWYSKQGSSGNTDHYRIKAVVPLMVRSVSQVNSFDCYCYPVLYYEGWKEHLLHFVFELWPKKTVLPTFSTQQTVDVIDLPIIDINNGQFILASKQHPCFSVESLSKIAQTKLSISPIIEQLTFPSV